MIQKQTLKQEITKADMNMVSDIYELVRITIKDIYKRYYSDEAVKFFLEFHSKENMIMDFLETEIVKHYGAVWLGSSLPAGKFYHDRGYMAKKYEEIQLENDKVLAYELMCRNQFPIDPNEYNAPSQLVRREMELQGIDLDELRKIFPKRVYLLADSLYDTMLSQNAGTLTYHVGGEVYILSHNHSVGFVKGEMCSPGIATQAEDLMAAGARELIHVGFAAAKFRSCRATGIYVISDSGSGDDWDLGWGGKTLETSINRVIEAIKSNG